MLHINGSEIRRRRQEAGLTLQELGDRVGHHLSYIGHLETGRRQDPSLGLTAALAEALGCKVDDLLVKGGEAA